MLGRMVRHEDRLVWEAPCGRASQTVGRVSLKYLTVRRLRLSKRVEPERFIYRGSPTFKESLQVILEHEAYDRLTSHAKRCVECYGVQR